MIKFHHKLTMLAAGGAGYVLGARAGRQRYEQIRTSARKVQHTVEDKAPIVKEKVNAAAHRGPHTDDGQASEAGWPADSEAPYPPPGV